MYARGGEPVDPGTPPRIGPADIASATFTVVRRRGLDPGEVYPYLRRIAREMAALIRENSAATEENLRLKTALVAWQAQLSPTRTAEGYLSRTPPNDEGAAPQPSHSAEFPTAEWPTQSPYQQPGPDRR